MADTFYFAAFCPAKEGGYAVFLPDFPEGVTQGEDIAEAMDMAEDVLKICLEEYTKERRPIPDPCDHAAAAAALRRYYAEAEGSMVGEGFVSLVRAPNIDRTPVHLSISMPKNAVDALDRKARHAGMTRSGYITAMALA